MYRTRRRRYRSRPSAPTCAASGDGGGRWQGGANKAMKIVERSFAEADRRALLDAGLHPVLARLFAARRIHSASELDYKTDSLHNPSLLKGAQEAARFLADAIAAGKRLLIIADYDADGATACAVGIRALRTMAGNSGASVDYLVPDRFRLGYGLSPELVDLAAQR